MHLLLWMNVVLDYICIGFAEQLGSGTTQKLQMKSLVSTRTPTSNLRVAIREKGRDLTQSYDKSPFIPRKIQKATRQHQNRHQKL